jgi:hypothetical protein
MCAWKIITLAAVLSAALIAAVVHQGSAGFARGGVVADRINKLPQTNSKNLPGC